MYQIEKAMKQDKKFIYTVDNTDFLFSDTEIESMSSLVQKVNTFDDVSHIFKLFDIGEDFDDKELTKTLNDVILFCNKYGIQHDMIESPKDWGFKKADFHKRKNLIEAFKPYCTKQPEQWFSWWDE